MMWEENHDPLRDYLKRQVCSKQDVQQAPAVVPIAQLTPLVLCRVVQIAKHAPFLAETITESVPQSLVQVLVVVRVHVSINGSYELSLPLLLLD